MSIEEFSENEKQVVGGTITQIECLEKHKNIQAAKVKEEFAELINKESLEKLTTKDMAVILGILESWNNFQKWITFAIIDDDEETDKETIARLRKDMVKDLNDCDVNKISYEKIVEVMEVIGD